jgi:hypothetical protein
MLGSKTSKSRPMEYEKFQKEIHLKNIITIIGSTALRGPWLSSEASAS